MIILWKDNTHSEAIVWYDQPEYKISLVVGHIAEMAVALWDKLKGDQYLLEAQWSADTHGPWPEMKDSLETPLPERSYYSSYQPEPITPFYANYMEG